MALRLIGKLLAALAIGIVLALGYANYSQDSDLWGQVTEDMEYSGGWDGSPQLRLRMLERNRGGLLRDLPSEWKAGGAGKTRLLYQDYEEVFGHPYEPRHQGKSPSCVGQAVASAVDILAAIQIKNGRFERAPPAKVDAGVVYGMSRQEIGDVGIGGAGSHNEWACQALQQYGTVFMLNYGLLGIDLTEFDPQRAIQYGREGCPDSLEPVARLHLVKDYIQITSWEDLRDAINYGCPVVVGSAQGFGSKSGAERDADGFLSPPRRLFFKSTWRHSMCIIGMSDEGREGVLILNSWGPDWVGGPKRFGDEPEGSFWVDKAVIERMIAAGDTYAIRGFQGFPNYTLARPANVVERPEYIIK